MYRDKENVFSVFRLRILSILWCEGGDGEKLEELYDLVREGGPTIAHNDKEFVDAFFLLLEMSVDLVIK